MKKTASLIKRNIAQFIDMVLLMLILMLNGAIVYVLKVYYPFDLISYFLIGFIFFVFNNAYMQGSRGFTVGKAFLKIKVVNNIGCPIGVSKSFIREFAKLYTPLTLFIAYFSALGIDKRQSWHDKIVDSYVVDDKSSDVYLIQLMKKIKNKHIRFFKDYDEENFTFLNEISSLADAKRCYKVYIDNQDLVTKFGYFVDSSLVSYTKFYYEDYSTTMFEFFSNGNFSHGKRYFFDKKGLIIDVVPISKKGYEVLRSG